MNVMNLKSFEFDISDIILRIHKAFYSWFSLHVTFMEKEPFAKFYGVFYHILRTSEITLINIFD